MASSSTAINGGLIGQYGFIADYSISESDVNERVQAMWQKGIREFQFYDWFENYTTPFSKGKIEWQDPYFKIRPIYKATIQKYIKVIREFGGRSWGYIQMVAGGANEDSKHFKLKMHEDTIPCYLPSEQWAELVCNRWVEGVKELGFDGIHWDTLGKKAEPGDEKKEEDGIHNFLKKSHAILKELNLKQTANLVSCNWWDDKIIHQYLQFPYTEVWSESEEEDFYTKIQKLFSIPNTSPSQLLGVIAYYDEDEDVMNKRSKKASEYKCSYLMYGDGDKRLAGPYFPDAAICWGKLRETLESSRTFALRTHDNAHYLCAEGGGGGIVHAQYKENHHWQKFTVLFHEGRQISLQTHDGKHYISVVDQTVNAEFSGTPGDDQKFEVVIVKSGKIALKTLRNLYLSAENNGGGKISTQPHIGDWERFSYEIT